MSDIDESILANLTEEERAALETPNSESEHQEVDLEEVAAQQQKQQEEQQDDDKDKKDTLLLTQTHLEQIQTNQNFRELADFLSDITYLQHFMRWV